MHRAAHGRHVGSGNPAAVLALVNAAFAVDVPATRTASPATILWANARTQEVHDHGLCNKARLHYECHGRDNYRECC